MKQYWVREIGWAYDDSDYYKDGERRVVEIFDTYEQANEFAKALNREYIFNRFSGLYRYLFSDDFAEKKINAQKLHQYLVDELDFNPTILLHPGRRVEYESLMFLSPPTDEQLDKIVEITAISFFRIVEVEKEYCFRFYKAKYGGNYLKYSGFLYSNADEKAQIFNTPLEAMEKFNSSNKSFTFFKEYDKEAAYITDELTSISLVPKILDDFIQNNQYLTYEEGRLRIPFEVDTQTLFQLNALLAEPFLIYEEIALDDSFFYETPHQIKSSVSRDIAEIEFRLHRFRSKEILKNSPAHLVWFYMKFHRFLSKGYNYFELINQYYSDHTNENYPRYGLIKNMKLEAETYSVVSTFSPGKVSAHPSFEKEGIGTGKDIHEAFYNSLKDWLEKHAQPSLDNPIQNSTK